MSITMQELIEATEWWHSVSDCKVEGYFDGCELCQAITKAQQPYTPENRPSYPWVKVEDGLPESDMTVLAVWKHKEGYAHFALSYFDEFWNQEDTDMSNSNWNVTHWQYLPALPKE